MQTVVLFSTVLINIKWVINHNDFIKSSYVRHSLYAQLPLQVSAKPPNKLSTQSGYILSEIPDDIQARLICGLTQTHILAVSGIDCQKKSIVSFRVSPVLPLFHCNLIINLAIYFMTIFSVLSMNLLITLKKFSLSSHIAKWLPLGQIYTSTLALFFILSSIFT